ncbi:MAG: site-specific integrase [Armatimonadetes bacterium]|nr:site-specific integrase [Armatimonadota bacterium]
MSKTRRTGQIIPRGPGVFVVRIFLGRDETGRRKYHNHTVRGSKKDAQTWLNAALREKDLGSFTPGAKVSVSEYFDHWLEASARARLKPQTLKSYSQHFDLYLKPTLGARRLDQLAPLEIQTAYTGLMDGGLSARTVQYGHAILRASLKQAVRWGLLARNPCDLVEPPKPSSQQKSEKPPVKAFTRQQTDLFLRTADRITELGRLFRVAVNTGLRPGEILGLQWTDIDFPAARLHVQRVLVNERWRVEGAPILHTPKTRKSRRPVLLPPTALQALQQQRTEQLQARMAAGALYQNLDLVFADAHGGPLEERRVGRVFKRVLKAAGLPSHFALYSLRHTAATLLLLAGVNPKVVSDLLGHASVTITLDVYSHVLPSLQEETAAHMERLLGAEADPGGDDA